jgi:DNA helicase-2/ATP-dependent DNA helicase PcrA
MEVEHDVFVAVEAGTVKTHAASVSGSRFVPLPTTSRRNRVSETASTVGDVSGPPSDPHPAELPGAAAAYDAAEAAQLDRLVHGLNPAQAAAVTSTASPLRILAGAGSGKTRVLTHRIAHGALTGHLDPHRVLAVTFTRKAAGELRTRLGRLGLRDGVQAGTFHAIAYAQLRQRWEERGVRPPELLERKVGYVARLMPSSRDRTAPLDAVTEIEWASARRVGPQDYVAAAARFHRTPPLEPSVMADVYQRFMDKKLKDRLVDFDDLLRLAARDLAADPVYASARHWRFRHLFVDEFQDVNPLQFELLRAWLGPESDLCVVGDPNQAIYAWNGADARYLTQFDEFFPGGDTVTLEDNYRSTPQILAAANAVLADGPSVPIRLRPNRGAGPLPTVRQLPDQTAEAQAVARAVRDHHRPGQPWSEQAVLVRTNAQAVVMAEALTTAKIPHTVRGAGDLLEQPEVKEAIASLRTATSLGVGLGDLELSLADATNEDRAANVAELVRLGREYLVLDPTGGVPGFMGWVTSALRGEDRRGGDAVEIVTFHAAKGLEWPVVHLAGLEEGFVPIHFAEDADSVDEERRLLYVALTRAREELHCTWAARREFGTRSMKRKPSPWLGVLSAAVGAAPPPLDKPATARRASEARSANRGRPADVADEDAALVDALKRWRKDKARAGDVPAYVIFNDATLMEIAAGRPRSRNDLLEVPGMGPVKVERFGDELLALVVEHPRGATTSSNVTRLGPGPRSGRPEGPETSRGRRR